MGAWGTGPFDNDAAGDLLVELRSGPGRIIGRSLRAVAKAKPGTYLEVDEGGAAWAAAELVAAAFGYGLDDAELPDDAAELLESLRPTSASRTLALAALPRLLDPASSELAELWAESDDEAAWRARVEDTRRRLEAAEAGPRPRPRLVAGDLVLLPDPDGAGEVLVQVLSAREVLVFEGTVRDEAEALAVVSSRGARRLPTRVPRLLRAGRRVGHARPDRALAGPRLYAVESGAIDGYFLMTASGTGLRAVDWPEAQAHERLDTWDLDALRRAAAGTLPVARVRAPEVREAALRATRAERWAERRQASGPGPFGDPEALARLLDWIEAYGVENAIARMEDLAAGRQGYGRPSEDAERGPWAFIGLVAHWQGRPELAPWPLADRAVPEANAPQRARALAAARRLLPEVETRDAELRLIWGDELSTELGRLTAGLE